MDMETRIEHFTDPARVGELAEMYRFRKLGLPDKDGWVLERYEWEWDVTTERLHGSSNPKPIRIIGTATFKRVKLAKDVEVNWAQRAGILAKQLDDMDVRHRAILKRAKDAEAAFEELQRRFDVEVKLRISEAANHQSQIARIEADKCNKINHLTNQNNYQNNYLRRQVESLADQVENLTKERDAAIKTHDSTLDHSAKRFWELNDQIAKLQRQNSDLQANNNKLLQRAREAEAELDTARKLKDIACSERSDALFEVSKLKATIQNGEKLFKSASQTIRTIDIIVTTSDGIRSGKTFDKDMKELSSWK